MPANADHFHCCRVTISSSSPAGISLWLIILSVVLSRPDKPFRNSSIDLLSMCSNVQGGFDVLESHELMLGSSFGGQVIYERGVRMAPTSIVKVAPKTPRTPIIPIGGKSVGAPAAPLAMSPRGKKNASRANIVQAFFIRFESRTRSSRIPMNRLKNEIGMPCEWPSRR
jgi:hypothetical protein